MSGDNPSGPSIAVVIPNRNDARYLSTCLRSVFEQDVAPDEVVVIDDASTDDSVALIRSEIAGRAFARLIENPVNLGTYGAVDVGLKDIRSEYVLFLAANDFVLPGIFAHAKACLARSPGAGLWSAMAWLVDERDRPIRLHNAPVVSLEDAFFPPSVCRSLAHQLGSWFTGTTLIYRRDVLEQVGRFDPAYGGLSDLITALTVTAKAGAAYSPVPFGAMRVHAGGYLSRTLADPKVLDGILARVSERGPALAPELFSPTFLERTALRFRFAAARAAPGTALSDIAGFYKGGRGTVLRAVDRIVPKTWPRTRVALAFLVLRPFDLLPTLWYRLIAWSWIRLRLAARGRTPTRAKEI